MLQHTGLEVFDHSSQCRISYTILDTGDLKNTRHLIFLKIVLHEPDTDTDIITALLQTMQQMSVIQLY